MPVQPTAESMVWFRRDLRVDDNLALAHATESKPRGGVVGLFVVTHSQWKQHHDSDHKVAFTMASLRALSESLAKINIPLLVEVRETFEEIPACIRSLCEKLEIKNVFFNREYEVYESERDTQVHQSLNELGVSVKRLHDRVIVPPQNIKTKDERFYRVFTPYRKVWDKRVADGGIGAGRIIDSLKPADPPQRQHPVEVAASPIPTNVEGFERTSVWESQFPAGETAAKAKLDAFVGRIANYKEHRDLPSVDGTSGLSPYLAAGVISPRRCLEMAYQTAQSDKNAETFDGAAHEGATVWVSELAWRDFYTHVMVGFPRVSKSLPFKLETNRINWRADEKDFQAWCEGRTGFPIVDAGMRQLNQTGWMHNRLRMVTAMFLTKNLLIDWRLGERYFMKQLIDGDLAANNGGWQWSASTGTDAVPYFRIFSPFSQSKRFDADGIFIKRMCPELKSVPAKALHDQKKLATELAHRNTGYPEFVVDYKASRERVMEAFATS